MCSITTSHGVFLATAMAVSGTVILLAFSIHKSTTDFLVNSMAQSPRPVPRSCISLEGKKQEKKKKKRVHFAEDVVDPIGNSEEYRRMHRHNLHNYKNLDFSNTSALKKGGKMEEMQANRMALYNGILRDRVHHRVPYSS